MLLQDLASDWDSGVDRIGDDTNKRLRTGLSNSRGQIGHNGGVHVEEVISGHARLAGHASWDHNHVAALERALQLGWANVRANLALGLDVAQVRSDSLGVLHIIQRQVVQEWRLLEEER